jgi:hypothetical protein
MKITLTQAEVDVILREKYNLSSNDKLEILHLNYPEDIDAVILKIEKMRLGNDNKISCIKAFRDHFAIMVSPDNIHHTVGLADAKGIIENWEAFKKYAMKYQKLPRNFYDCAKLNCGIPN